VRAVRGAVAVAPAMSAGAGGYAEGECEGRRDGDGRRSAKGGFQRNSS